MYGIARIAGADSPVMKVLWLLMSLVSLAACIQILVKTSQDYLSYDVFTQTKRVHPVISILPTVVFCTDSTDLTQVFSEAVFVSKNGSRDLISEMFLSNIVYGEFSGYVCIKFNYSHDKNRSREPEAANELAAVHDKNTDLFQFGIADQANFSYIDVFIMDNYLNLLDWSLYVTTFDPTKKTMFIDLTKRIEVKLEVPYSQCQTVADPTYRHANCDYQCRNDQFAAHFNCTLTSYYSLEGYQFCHDEQVAAAVALAEFDSLCQTQCPQECTSTKFDALISGYSDSALTFYITYQDTSYIEIRETAKMKGYSLIAEIGGALGLFVGITFLSLLEFLEYFSDIFLILFKRPITVSH